jgi:transposase
MSLPSSLPSPPSPPSPSSQLSPPSCFIGVDVAKASLVIAQGGQLLNLPNRKRNLQRWLRSLPEGCAIALEATSHYHQLLTDLAYAAGHTVYVLNPKQLKHYRTATAARAKTDSCDALLIARYSEREHAQLHAYQPLSEPTRRLCALLRRRATLVKCKTQVRLSVEEQAQELNLSQEVRALLKALDRVIAKIDKQIAQLLQLPQHAVAAARLQSIVGIGPLTGSALLVALQRGNFESADAFVAFLGLDPVPRDSGQSTGRRRLSKQGDSETRRLLFNAAMSASKTSLWRPFYQRYRQRGLSAIQTLCIMARKLARLAWTLNHHQTNFCQKRFTDSLT